MQFAAITGWGEGLPPSVLTNDDLSTFLETSDEWITTRTGMKERRISHVSAIEMATVAAARALACAGLDAADVDLIVYGGCSNEETVPNSASGVQVSLDASRAAAMDLNTACTSFLYGLSAATAMIQNGTIRNAVVIGVELISRYLDWSNRNVAVLFGDGAAAVVVQATDRKEGVVGSVLGCDAEARQVLRVRGIGCGYAGYGVTLGDTVWDFDGQAIFKRAVKGMSEACERVMRQGPRLRQARFETLLLSLPLSPIAASSAASIAPFSSGVPTVTRSLSLSPGLSKKRTSTPRIFSAS